MNSTELAVWRRLSSVLPVFVFCVSTIGLSSVGHAQEDVQPPQSDAPSDSDDLDDLLKGLDLGPATDSVPSIPDASDSPPSGPEKTVANPENQSSLSDANKLAAAFESMKKAGRLLSAGQTDTTVLEAQQQAVDLLDQLISAQQENAQQNQSQQSQPQQTEQQGEPQQSEADANAENQPSPQSDDSTQGEDTGEDSNEDESENAGNSDDLNESDEGGSAAVSAAGTSSPLNAAGQGVWGHLPQKTRGMLRADIPTDYLPKYSQQISDYFRALAEMSSEQ